ncbi:hypothetical protein SAMN04488505_102491 [Chitinophaga rupis]|uniref:DUF2938 domain-containing protein n=1 Tax=Chitinophaga rupis TaxID=573321 RepID=A0A1H7R275_9BACT|nr:hypothetical protein [Chitinophaga rupis]SEL53667.1 hypothetical protein SAMN04488505_102491 [Chitinophaga rupis]
MKFVLAGIAGTAVMTGFAYLLSFLANKNWRVIHVLAAVLSGPRLQVQPLPYTRTRLIIAGVVHYVIGVLFAIAYRMLVDAGVVSYTFTSAALYGVAIGVLAMLVWRITFALRYKPHGVQLSSYLPVIGSGHILFSLVMMVVLRL